MGTAQSAAIDRNTASSAAPGERVIRLPSFARPLLVVLNFAAQAVPMWLMYSLSAAWPVLIIAGILLGAVPLADHFLGKRNYSFDDGIGETAFRRLLMLQALFLLCTFAGSVNTPVSRSRMTASSSQEPSHSL